MYYYYQVGQSMGWYSYELEERLDRSIFYRHFLTLSAQVLARVRRMMREEMRRRKNAYHLEMDWLIDRSHSTCLTEPLVLLISYYICYYIQCKCPNNNHNNSYNNINYSSLLFLPKRLLFLSEHLSPQPLLVKAANERWVEGDDFS